tara:strand:+ start:161 stop:1015 length:855 start_codon:yes stop_codon:yes gene_type:complete
MNTLNNKVSIVINTYNNAQYLLKAVQSCLDQSYKNLEIIIWDNCSTDNTKEKIEKLNSNLIKYYIANNHTNLYEARNLASDKISGDYFCYLDADDEFLKNKIEVQLNILKSNNAQISYSNLFIKKNFKKEKLYFNKLQESGLIYNNLIKNYNICFNSILFSSEILNNYKFDNNLNILGDFDFVLKLSKKYKFIYNHMPLSIYNIHEKNFTNQNSEMHKNEIRYWFIKKKNYHEIKENKKFILEQYQFIKKLNDVKKMNFLKLLTFLILHKKNKIFFRVVKNFLF